MHAFMQYQHQPLYRSLAIWYTGPRLAYNDKNQEGLKMINDNFSTAALSTHSELACSEAISQPSAQFSAALHLNRVLECGAIIDMGIQEELALPSKAWKKICQSLNTLL